MHIKLADSSNSSCQGKTNYVQAQSSWEISKHKDETMISYPISSLIWRESMISATF